MKLYKFTVKDYGYDEYCGFIVAEESIPKALETIYQHVCLDKEGKLIRDIPYNLRSSNMDIQCLGDFIPANKFSSKILMVDFNNA